MQRRLFLTALGACVLPLPAAAQMITAQNELERAFLEALQDETARPAFRRELLASQVALALASDAPDAGPRLVRLNAEVQAGAIFTSTTRLDSVLGPASPRRVLAGRAAFERLRGQHVVLNYRLVPMLTLEPEDVEQYLSA